VCWLLAQPASAGLVLLVPAVLNWLGAPVLAGMSVLLCGLAVRCAGGRFDIKTGG
jgi:hypothetical protein